MNSRETFEMRVNIGVLKPEDCIKTIHYLVTVLIEALYIPVLADGVSVRDSSRTAHFEIAEEPINWGDLKCCGVDQHSEGFTVTIDEASPGDCPTFCAYIEKYMKVWGWEVDVVTEW